MHADCCWLLTNFYQLFTHILGETVTITFEIAGDYMPEIRFFKGKREIKPGNKAKFDVDTAAKTGSISMIKPKYVDEGKYSIQLISSENTISDDANFNIFVKGNSLLTFTSCCNMSWNIHT